MEELSVTATLIATLTSAFVSSRGISSLYTRYYYLRLSYTIFVRTVNERILKVGA